MDCVLRKACSCFLLPCRVTLEGETGCCRRSMCVGPIQEVIETLARLWAWLSQPGLSSSGMVLFYRTHTHTRTYAHTRIYTRNCVQTEGKHCGSDALRKWNKERDSRKGGRQEGMKATSQLSPSERRYKPTIELSRTPAYRKYPCLLEWSYTTSPKERYSTCRLLRGGFNAHPA